MWNLFKIWKQIWHIYTLMRPVLYENNRDGVGYFIAKKDTLTLIYFGMNEAVWVKQ